VSRFGKITALGGGLYALGFALSESACAQDLLIELIKAGSKGECYPVEKASVISLNVDFGLLPDGVATTIAATTTTSVTVAPTCSPAMAVKCKAGAESFCAPDSITGCMTCSCRRVVTTTTIAPVVSSVYGCIYDYQSQCPGGKENSCAAYEIDVCTATEINSITIYLVVTRAAAADHFAFSASLSETSCNSGLTIPVIESAAAGDCTAVEKISFLVVNLDIALLGADAGVATPTATTTVASAPSCSGDSNCKACNKSSGLCEKCDNFKFLNSGERYCHFS